MTRAEWDNMLNAQIRAVTHASANLNLCIYRIFSHESDTAEKELARETRDWWAGELHIATCRLKQWVANNPYPEDNRTNTGQIPDENPDAYADASAEALRDADRVKGGYR